MIAYARLKNEGEKAQRTPSTSALYGIGLVCTAVVTVTLLATSGQSVLPELMRGNGYTPVMPVVVATICMLASVALVELWRRPQRSTIDLWLMVTMCAWIFDIALSALLNGGRFDLGFYAGRLYGLMAATFVLVVLLTRTTGLYARLSRLLETEQIERRHEAAMRRRIFDTSLDLILVADRQGNVHAGKSQYQGHPRLRPGRYGRSQRHRVSVSGGFGKDARHNASGEPERFHPQF